MTTTFFPLDVAGDVARDPARAFSPNDLLYSADQTQTTIAPFLDGEPQPSHSLFPFLKARSFALPSRVSLATFSSSRLHGGSSSSTIHRPWIESQSTLSTGEDTKRSAEDLESLRSRVGSSSSHSGSLNERKGRSVTGGFFSKLRNRSRSKARQRSKARPRTDSTDGDHPSLRPPSPIPDAYTSFLPIVGAHIVPPPQPAVRKVRTGRKKSSTAGPELVLDTDMEVMDGIVDISDPPSVIIDPSSPPPLPPPPQSTASHGDGISLISDSSSFTAFTSSNSAPEFRNPFLPVVSTTPENPRPRKKSQGEKHKRISPKDKSLLPPTSGIKPPSHLSRSHSFYQSRSGTGTGASWIAPESWEVTQGLDTPEPEYSSSEESGTNNAGAEGKTEKVQEPRPDKLSVPVSPLSTVRKSKKGKERAGGGTRHNDKPLPVKIYRPNLTYNLVPLPPSMTVASVIAQLYEKMSGLEEASHYCLYLKERGRERLLGLAEHPTKIVRRRLQQAGYDHSDEAEFVKGTFDFLLKFVFKSEYLGPETIEEAICETFTNVDLTARGLRAIPVVLHQNAESIVSLRLSANPMLEIPLDFIQSCTSLRELRLSNMAMKKVPQSVRHSTTLNRLDLSCNHIADLEEAFLDKITSLCSLFLQNNRIEKLPWYFPRLRDLVTLNVSNNKFRTFPLAITQLDRLRDLDISFNSISELPDLLGRLSWLERLIIVGNHVSRFPAECRGLVGLRVLDCRRNQIGDLGVVLGLPKLLSLSAEYNALQALNLASLGESLTRLDASHNEITQLSFSNVGIGRGSVVGEAVSSRALTSLDISHAKLSSLDGMVFRHLSLLRKLKLDHNSFRALPETLGELGWLEMLSCSDNKLDALPASIGNLQMLETLDAHNNSLTELPASLWNCGALTKINATSNFLGVWHEAPRGVYGKPVGGSGSGASADGRSSVEMGGRRTSSGSLVSPVFVPPLALSLERLYLGENRLNDEFLHWLMVFHQLRVLNLSFNDLQDLPTGFLNNFGNLEELYLSGNKLKSLPSEDLHRLTNLTILYLNGNKLHTLPQELCRVKNLTVLDVGSNLLKYNVNNWEFDWNWNFNKNLVYLNLSGNNRLQIKADPMKRLGPHRNNHSLADGRQSLSGFTNLSQLRVLGLMDVTITTTGTNATVDIPDENEDRRVRTSSSTVLGMPYGIADSLGKENFLGILDLVHEFRDREDEAIFAMFARINSGDPGATPNRLVKFLHDHYIRIMREQLASLRPSETTFDVLRRTFLRLNQDLHDALYSHSRKMSTSSHSGRLLPVDDHATLRGGATGVVVYFVGRTMYVANVGNALAIVSRQGEALAVSRKHDPFSHPEILRIRAAEGWVSPPGLVNDEVDVSRAFGFFHLLPIVNARPDIFMHEISPQDEFVIIANRGLWDYVSYQTAVDIARSERADPMIASQKLRDFAMSYGVDESTMIMVIGVGVSVIEPEINIPKKIKHHILDRQISRLDGEVPAPVGHLALVFSDIRNSTHLWEVNPGMATAHRIHNTLLRRQLRFCGGYEVKTEGDAFMCSFPTSLAAVWFCLTVQQQLLLADWPLEILECEDGKPFYDAKGNLLAKGLSVRMGIHCGTPVPEPDPITGRMDYFGPMVNRSARICGNAAGGQIMCSAEIIREINASIFHSQPETEHSKHQSLLAIDAIRNMGITVKPVGEVKLKGLEVPEHLSCLYPPTLTARHEWGAAGPATSGFRVPFSIPQINELGMICLRLEALTSSRVFRPFPDRKSSIQTTVSVDENEEPVTPIPRVIYGDPKALLPAMSAQSTDAELMASLDSLSMRIANAAARLAEMYGISLAVVEPPRALLSKEAIASKLTGKAGLDEQTLNRILSLLDSI